MNLSNLDKFFATIPTANAPAEVAALLQPLADFAPILRRKEAQVTFFGAFKAGKSTLLNAIIGSPVLPSRVNRATGVITKIGWAAEPGAWVVRGKPNTAGRSRTPIFFDDVARYVLLDLSETTSRAPEGVEEVHLRLPHLLTKDRCNLVDTPGLLDNQALTERTFAELERTDLAVMVLAADKLVSEVESQAARRAHRLLGGNLVFIVNRLGMIDEESREEVIEWAQESFKGLGNALVGQPRIFATEAKGALDSRKKNRLTADPHAHGLQEFEQWLQTLLDSPAGRQVILLSRLGILETGLAKVLTYAQSQLKEAQTAVKGATRQDESTYGALRESWQREIASRRQRLAAFKNHLDGLGEAFARDCRAAAQHLLDTDPDSSQKLGGCFEPALQTYPRNVSQGVGVTVQQPGLNIPAFALSPTRSYAVLNAPGGPLETISTWLDETLGVQAFGQVGANIGGWLNQNIFKDEARRKTLEAVEQAISQLLPVLKEEAETYIYKVDGLLSEFGQRNAPARPPASSGLKVAQYQEYYFQGLVSWCNEFQETIKSLKS